MSLDIEITCYEVGSIRKLPSEKISVKLYNAENFLDDISASWIIDSFDHRLYELLEEMELEDIVMFMERKGYTVTSEGG